MICTCKLLVLSGASTSGAHLLIVWPLTGVNAVCEACTLRVCCCSRKVDGAAAGLLMQ